MSGDYLANRMIDEKIKESRKQKGLKYFESAYDFHKALEELAK